MHTIDQTLWQELVNAKIDGTLTADQENQLGSILAESAAAREYLEKLMQVHQMTLEDASDKQQSPGLTDGVMKSIRENKPSPAKKTVVKKFDFRQMNQNFLRYAAILIFGLMIGSGITWLIREGSESVHTGHALGTMHARQLQPLRFEATDTQITIEPVIAGQMLLILITADSESTINLFFHMNPGNYRIVHTRFISYDQRPMAESSSGRVLFGIKGRTVLQLVAEYAGNPPPSIPVELEIDGVIVFNSELFLR